MDDTIRNILSHESAVRAVSGLGAMKNDARKNTDMFTVWLAESLECVAGRDFFDCAIMLEVLLSKGVNNQSSSGGGEETKYTTALVLPISIDGSISRMEDDIMSGTLDGWHNTWNNYHIGGVRAGGNTAMIDDRYCTNFAPICKSAPPNPPTRY